MPPRPVPTAAFLAMPVLVLLGSGAATAQSAGGWVDPPARVRSPLAEPGAAALAPSGAAVAERAQGPSHGGEPNVKDEVRPAAAAAPAPRAAPTQRAEHRAIDRPHDPIRHAAAGASDREAAARRLASAYLASISAPNAATLAATPRFYGDHVRFHGRGMSTAALIAEKRAYFHRWPERRYAALDGGMRSACDGAHETCTVTTLMGFRAEDPARGARSQGVGQLVLTIGFAGDRPVIVSESSRVLQRGTAALSEAERGRPGA